MHNQKAHLLHVKYERGRLEVHAEAGLGRGGRRTNATVVAAGRTAEIHTEWRQILKQSSNKLAYLFITFAIM